MLRRVLRYDEVELVVPRLNTLSGRFLTSCVLRLLARRSCVIRDGAGDKQNITAWDVIGLAISYIRDLTFGGIKLRRQADQHLRALDRARSIPRQGRFDASKRPLYLRTDTAFGIASGGSIGHIAGVLNNLGRFVAEPIFVSTDRIPTVSREIETYIVSPAKKFWDFNEMLALHSSEVFSKQALGYLAGRDIGFIYHRYSLNNFSGMTLAHRLNVPYVLEFNGSETWVSEHWGRGLRHATIAGRIESLCLRFADVIVVVSEPLRKLLVLRGVQKEKILVNPNGVDVEKYRPDIDGAAVRARYGIEGRIVVGFMGTFGKWHGAEVLTSAMCLLIQGRPELKDRLALLMIGDGPGREAARSVLEKADTGLSAVFTGLVPQSDGPTHLAACDILVSPHVPNPDGSPFFGSPTKLFEYMAMGRPIVASNLGQIGEVLEHGRTAWLVHPGDAGDLARGIQHVLENMELGKQLAAAAREAAATHHTWTEHTRRIVEKVRERCG